MEPGGISFTFEVIMQLDALLSAETETMHAKQTKRLVLAFGHFQLAVLLQVADTGHILQY